MSHLLMATKHKRVAIALPPELKASIAHLADKHRRSQSGEIAVALEQWIANHAADMADMADMAPTDLEDL